MNRTTIVAIFAVFFAPVVIAVLLHSQWFDWRPDQTRNHGELLTPPFKLPAFRLADDSGRTVVREDLTERWQLMHVTALPCQQACTETLYWLRQVRRAQDRHQPEVGLVLVTPHRLDDESRRAIEALETDLLLLTGPAGAALLDLLPDDREAVVSYILDPQANIILRYPEGSDFNGMRRDLRRLLTWTRTDQPSTSRRDQD